MKKYYTVILLLTTVINQSKAQLAAGNVQATFLSGYTFLTELPVSNGSATIEGGYTFGIELGFQQSEVLQIDLYYQNQLSNTDVSYADVNTSQLVVDKDVPTATQYGMLGATYNFKKSQEQKLSAFVGLALGVAFIHDRTDYYGTYYLFGIGAKAGLNYFFNDRIGIQIRGQLSLPIEGAGGSFYVGTGGSGVAFSTYSAAVQFAPMGGIVLNLSKKQQ